MCSELMWQYGGPSASINHRVVSGRAFQKNPETPMRCIPKCQHHGCGFHKPPPFSLSNSHSNPHSFASPLFSLLSHSHTYHPVLTQNHSHVTGITERGSHVVYKANVREIVTEGAGDDVRAVGVRLADGRVFRWGRFWFFVSMDWFLPFLVLE